MKNLGRNFIIAFLMVLAIYQTGELWFGDFSDHNFFSLFENKSTSYSDNMAYSLDRIFINLGDNRVVSRSGNIQNTHYKTEFDRAIALALEEGTMADGVSSVNWSALLNNRAVIYDYSVLFNGSDLIPMFNVGKSDVCNRISSWDTIILVPRADNSLLRVTFFDTVTKSASVVDLKSNNIIGDCYETASEFLQSDDSIYYISSEKNGFDIFTDNVFLPQSKEDTYSYRSCEPHYFNDSSSMEKNASIFFDNAVIGTKTKDNESLTFSDESVVVKFYDNKVMEYFSYSAKNGSGTDLYSNYKAAVEMIKRDVFVTNDVYLSRYTNEDGRYIFYFDYKINNMNIMPSDEIKKSTGMNSFIEVIASEGSVDRYRKYTCRYTLSDENIYNADIDFVSAVDKVYAEHFGASPSKPVDNIYIAYMADNKAFGIKWVVSIDNQDYVVDTK